MEKNWHTITASQVIKELQTHKTRGLSQEEVIKRQKQYGLNKLPAKKKLSLVVLFLSQFNNILIYILVVAAVISFFLHEVVDGYIILAAIIINVIVGFVQEFKAQNALEKLSEIIEHFCVVIRDGHQHKIHIEGLVPGDLVLLTAGNNIPADCRLIDITDFEVNEASLTGESVPVEKKKTVNKKVNEVLGQRFNMVYMGTLATRGHAVGVVTAIGLKTEIGKIASLLKDTESEQTPLQKNLGIFSKKLGFIILIACLLIFVVGLFLGRPFVEMFTIAVAAAVSAIPEGLVIAVTVILAIGMQRILKKHALVRKLVAAETLGSTDVVCSDKTGTLTEGKMVVQRVVTLENDIEVAELLNNGISLHQDIDTLLTIGFLANNAVLENPQEAQHRWKYIGAPTEIAMLHVAIILGKERSVLLKQLPEIDEEPFNSTRKYMMSLHQKGDDQNVLYFNGAPERIFALATRVEKNGVAVPLTEKLRKQFLALHNGYTSQGMRLLGVGYKLVDSQYSKIETISKDDIVFVGYFIIKDPVRKGVAETISVAKKAGIRTVMITGDHKNTAAAIATELGLHEHSADVLTGADLAEMTDGELQEAVNTVHVYARVSPQDKLRIVDAFQANHHVVAMTGDGINDAPALKSADIGIAVGAGTDVTKGVADMILLDNNFQTIIAAIKEGRVIVDNIKKVIVYLLADSFSAMVLVLGSLFIGLPLPITAAQVLWINLITDGFPYMALTMERGESDIMNMKPRKKNSGILDAEMKTLIFIIGIVTDVVLLILFWYYYRLAGDLTHARTIVFAALGIDTLLYSFSCKSLRQSLWRINVFDNKYLLWAVGLGLGIQLLALYTPFLSSILELDRLAFSDWLIIIPLAFIKITGIELVKYWFISHPQGLAKRVRR